MWAIPRLIGMLSSTHPRYESGVGQVEALEEEDFKVDELGQLEMSSLAESPSQVSSDEAAWAREKGAVTEEDIADYVRLHKRYEAEGRIV